MRFLVEGKEYAYDGKLRLKDAMFIHEKSGVGIGRLNHELLIEGHPQVIAAWVFLLKRQAGEAVRWEDIERIDISDFRPLPDPVEETEHAEAEPSGAPDPTSRSGKTRKRATTAT